ncbi:MAG TPA: hypothetical protein VLA15_02795, partial [Desulfurivibrionaceae bacterium]|nr:hypothetical protein [Desulfurivibrionaceae bacterium]
MKPRLARYFSQLKHLPFEMLKVVAKSRVALVGAVVAGLLLPVLLFSMFLDMHGLVDNPYFGFLIYMVMGPLFVAGLL